MSFQGKVTKAKEIKENGKWKNQYGSLLVTESDDDSIFQGWELEIAIDASKRSLVVGQMIQVDEHVQKDGNYGPWYSLKKWTPLAAAPQQPRSPVPGESSMPRSAPQTAQAPRSGGPVHVDEADGHARAYGRSWADYAESICPGAPPGDKLAFVGARIAWFQIELARTVGVNLDLGKMPGEPPGYVPSELNPPPPDDDDSIPF